MAKAEELKDMLRLELERLSEHLKIRLARPSPCGAGPQLVQGSLGPEEGALS